MYTKGSDLKGDRLSREVLETCRTRDNEIFGVVCRIVSIILIGGRV